MIKLITIIGARPQIIKAAAISRAIQNNFSDLIEEIIVHTGQHYDEKMSDVFFEELNIPKAKYNLGCGSASHGTQTAAMLKGIEEVLVKEKPNGIILYGDTNSTLAGAIAASKIHIPVIHIEAGLRSYNKAMPEEINRIACDHVSTFLFSPTKTGVNNLQKEGFNIASQPPYSIDNPVVYHCGDIMYDNSIYFSVIADIKSGIFEKFNLTKGEYLLATIHRNNNTDDPVRLNAIMQALILISEQHNIKILIPLHPRTAKQLYHLNSDTKAKLDASQMIIITEPASFLEMTALEKNCKMVITDSGGVQKEAYYFKKPCIILRSETEWIELVECGAAIITDADEQKITEAYKTLVSKLNLNFPEYFGNGKAAEFICNELVKHLK